MAAAKTRPAPFTDARGRKLQALRKGVDQVDPNKKYFKLADKRPHSERFNVTAERLLAIAQRMKDGK